MEELASLGLARTVGASAVVAVATRLTWAVRRALALHFLRFSLTF